MFHKMFYVKRKKSQIGFSLRKENGTSSVYENRCFLQHLLLKLNENVAVYFLDNGQEFK